VKEEGCGVAFLRAGVLSVRVLCEGCLQLDPKTNRQREAFCIAQHGQKERELGQPWQSKDAGSKNGPAGSENGSAEGGAGAGQLAPFERNGLPGECGTNNTVKARCWP
jgi:hypothetical protein